MTTFADAAPALGASTPENLKSNSDTLAASSGAAVAKSPAISPVISMSRNYSDDTLGAKVCLDRATALLESAAQTVPVSDGVFVMVDYGAADGGTALDLWRAARAAALARADVHTFHLVANDLPSNDFNALTTSLDTFASECSDTTVLMSPRSFYHRAMPARQVHLGFSATAMHWRMPCAIHGGVWSSFV